ncbi:MAG: GNAT family protein [Chitinophagaceae bacterium]
MDFNFEEEIILEDERVLLRPLKADDYNVLQPVAFEDPTLTKYSPSQIGSQELLQKHIQQALDDRQNKVRYAFVIFDKEKQQYAGSTSLAAISNKDLRLEIGWTWLGRVFQRTGLNRHCKFLLMQYVFDTLSFERVELKTDERNVQSRTAIQKIGGKEEGILRSHTLMSDGFRRNTVYYSILKEEWCELKNNFFQRDNN